MATKMKNKIKINISEEPHCNDLESLGNVFRPLIKDCVSAESFIEIDIIYNWKKIIGEDLAAFCQPVKVKFNPRENVRTVYIETPVGGFALELRHKEKYILDKINAFFGYKAVDVLNISQNVNMKISSQLKDVHKTALDLTAEDKKYLENMAEDIKDEKLKEILIKIGESVISSNKGA